MGTTHLSGLEVAGVPTMGMGGLPPFTGSWFFVNETTGSDGFSGAADEPFATLARAYAKCVAGNNDVVVIEGTVHISATQAWAKDKVHLIGLAGPSNNNRARISQTGSTVFSPLVNVTAQGCLFANFGTFHGFADASAQICWNELGGRNGYVNVQFLGMGNATAAAQAGGRSLVVGGSGENLFQHCTIGLDTVVRGVANASLEFIAGSPRNEFDDCVFQMDASAATPVHITVGAGGLDRYALFRRPTFINAVESGATIINAAVTANASAGGAVALQDFFSLGATAMATTGPVYGTGNIPTATTSGIAIKLT